MMDSKSHRRWICGQAAIVVVCSISVWLPGLAAQTSRDPVVVATQSTERSDVKTAKVTIDARQLPLKAVLVDIARQAKLNAVYGDAVSANRTLVTLRMTNVSAEQAFEQALAGTGIVARILPGNDVLFIPSAADTLPERHDKKTGSVKGRILDSITGQGIGNAVISVVGRSQKSTSAPDGHFTISDLSVGSVTLEIKMFGYKMVHRVVAVNGDNIATVDVMLSAISTMLSGVVTTATGSQRKLEVGSSIVSLNVDSIMQTAPIQSVTDLLESRVPGMILQRTSGTPGDPARIRLRGAGSITQNNDPIIVVDGMRMYSEQSEARNVNRETQRGGIQTGNVYTAPSPLDQIDPHSIETIEILKGPSAAAMYGSDAANGVIIITTKRGRAGAPQWYATATMGRTSMPGRWPEALWKWTTPIGGGAPVLCVGFCGDAVVDSSIWFSALNHKPLTVLGTGYTSDVSTSISGGRSNMTYALTLSGSNDDGVLKLPDVEERRFLRFHGRPAPGWMRNPDHLQSWSGAVNIGVEVTPAVQMRVMSSLNQMIQRKTSMASSSETAIAELERTWVDMSQLTETPILGNPYERVRSSTVTVRNSMDVNISPKPTLPVRVQIGTATLYRSDEIQLPRGLLLNTADSVGRWSGSTKSSSELTGLSSTEIPLHRRVALIMGMNYVQSRTDDQSGYFRDVPAGVADPSVGADNAGSRFQRTTSDRRSFGWFLEPRLRVSSRFFAMPGFRLDNNGLSGRNAGLNRLPKINLSWIVSEEPFFRNSNVVNLLRLRTAFGAAGVQPKPGDVLRLYEGVVRSSAGVIDSFYGNLLRLSYLGNTRLRPERGVEWEGGIDADLFGGRATLDVTYFRKSRRDAIIDVPIASSVTSAFPLRPMDVAINLGDIRNWGLELSLGAYIVERPMFRFGLNGTFSFHRSRILRLTDDGRRIAGAGYADRGIAYAVGYPMEAVWDRPIVGFHDVNGDGWIGGSEVVLADTSVFAGTTEPRYQATVSPTISLLRGRVSVNALLAFVGGVLQDRARYTSPGGGQTDPYEVLIAGPGGLERQAAFMALNGGPLVSKRGYRQMSDVVRLQSISILLDAPDRIKQLARAKSVSLSLMGQNVGLWTNYIGVDPNVNGVIGGSGLQDRSQLPQPRTWSVKISLLY